MIIGYLELSVRRPVEVQQQVLHFYSLDQQPLPRRSAVSRSSPDYV